MDMSIPKTIVFKDISPEIKAFMAMPHGPLKHLKFKNLGDQMCSSANLLFKDGNVFYHNTQFKIAQGKHSYFLRKTKKTGFTLNEKGKLQIWYGGNIKALPELMDIIKYYKQDWFMDYYLHFLTKGLLEKILTGKIHNPIGFFEAWLKAQHIKASPRLLYKAVEFKYNNISSAIEIKHILIKYSQVVAHVDQLLETIVADDYDARSRTFIDMMDQALILERIIDPKWSDKRIADEHQQYTKEIMELEITSMEDQPVKIPQVFYDKINDDNFTLLDTKKKIFMEGKLMKHCIYTNYWNSILNKKYLCFHVEYQGIGATLTLRRDKEFGELVIYDCLGRYNARLSNEYLSYVKSWLEEYNGHDEINQTKLYNSNLHQNSTEVLMPLPF